MKTNKINAYAVEMDKLEAVVMTEALWLDNLNDQCLVKEELQKSIAVLIGDEEREGNINIYIDDGIIDVDKETVDTIITELNNVIDPLEERSMILLPILK